MKRTVLLAVVFIGTGISTNLCSQSTSTSHIGVLGRHLGFNNSFTLRLETTGINRQIIRGGGAGPNAGRIAIGNNLPNNFIPSNRLHA